ncbi:MAG: epoxyqueuosine reductase QueH, partial [Firmicutes bacterium]|nr:epoxyqueuosine reductase QueH [Bacillota bacterium]
EFERRLPFSTQNAQRTTNNDFDAISPKMITEPYSPNNFFGIAKELGQEKEGGERCKKCFQLRLEKTFKKAKELGFDFFSTTLPISPHKNSKIIFEIGEKLSTINSGAMNPKFVPIDFKKNNGFGKAIELSKKMELYRQNYCGCEFSKRRH